MPAIRGCYSVHPVTGAIGIWIEHSWGIPGIYVGIAETAIATHIADLSPTLTTAQKMTNASAWATTQLQSLLDNATIGPTAVKPTAGQVVGGVKVTSLSPLAYSVFCGDPGTTPVFPTAV